MSEQHGGRLLAIYNEARNYTIEEWQKLDWDKLQRRIEEASQQDKELHEEVESRLEVIKKRIESL